MHAADVVERFILKFIPPKMEPEQACEQLAGELEDAARWLSAGGLSEREFCNLLSIVGKRKLNGSGLKLAGFRGGDGGVHFTLRTAADDLCIIMDMDPCTGRLVTRSPCWGA